MSTGTNWREDALATAAETYRSAVKAGADPSRITPCRIALEQFMTAHPGADVNEAHQAIVAAAKAFIAAGAA